MSRELVDELDRARALLDRPLSGIDDLVGLEPAVGRFLWLADGAHANSDKALAWLCLGVAKPGVPGEELLDRPGDRVVDLRIVAIEPLAEVLVAIPFQTGNGAGPVESSAAVVTLLRVGQVERRANAGVRELCLRELRCRELAQHGEDNQPDVACQSGIANAMMLGPAATAMYCRPSNM